MEDELGFDQLTFLHPKLRPYVKVILAHEFGLLRDSAEICNLHCGTIVRKNSRVYADRFQLKIPYCMEVLNWLVLMNGDDLTKAPDFIMEENFVLDAATETFRDKVPSLANWNPTDVKCLLNVVLELLELYKEYQVNILQGNPNFQRYLFEYETLLSVIELGKNDVELLVQFRSSLIIFMIHLSVDFSKLPTALPNSKDLVVLIVKFRENAKTTVQVVRRVEVKDALVGLSELPELSPDVSLMDYVPRLEELVQKTVQKAINHTHERKMLYSYLVHFFEPSLINGDNINFKRISFLLELGGFYCVLNVNIPVDYPETRPQLQLLSLNKKTPKTRLPDFTGFSFNPKMTHEQVARNIFSYVKETAISEFRKFFLE